MYVIFLAEEYFFKKFTAYKLLQKKLFGGSIKIIIATNHGGCWSIFRKGEYICLKNFFINSDTVNNTRNT